MLLLWGGRRRVIQDSLELLLQGPRGKQATLGVCPHTEESAPMEDGHMSAVTEVADVVWWRSGRCGQKYRGQEGRIHYNKNKGYLLGTS